MISNAFGDEFMGDAAHEQNPVFEKKKKNCCTFWGHFAEKNVSFLPIPYFR